MIGCCLNNNPDKNVGGQAVIEGVMIRSSTKVATAVRRPDGEIVSTDREFLPVVKRIKWLNIPILRGVIGLFEMLYIGSKSLNFSAEVAIEAEEEAKSKEKPGYQKKERKKQSDWMLGLTTVLALGLGILLFFFVPLWLSNLLTSTGTRSPLTFWRGDSGWRFFSAIFSFFRASRIFSEFFSTTAPSI